MQFEGAANCQSRIAYEIRHQYALKAAHFAQGLLVAFQLFPHAAGVVVLFNLLFVLGNVLPVLIEGRSGKYRPNAVQFDDLRNVLIFGNI